MRAIPINPLEAVGTEEIALRLNEVGRAARAAVGVEITERTAKRRNRHSVQSRFCYDSAQARVGLLDHG